MPPDITPQQLIQQAQQAYDHGDDKTCARHLWEAVYSSIQQLATRMGHPCQNLDQAKTFTRYLEREHSDQFPHADAMLLFGLNMLDHAEDGEWSQDAEFAWTFPEFPLVIRQITHNVETLTTQTETAKTKTFAQG